MNIINKLTFAALAATLLFQTSITRADDEGRDHRNATVTWTKWVTAWFPQDGTGNAANLGGVVGGDVGDGIFTGEALTIDPQPDGSIVIEADYHFFGSKHSLTVHFQLIQKADENGVVTGLVSGVVTDGWLKGNLVIGHYTGRACHDEEGVGLSLCFDGTAEILRGSKNKD